jgi:hypothetical protein
MTDKPSLMSWHFNAGGEEGKTLGICMRVKAYTPEEAVAKANAFLKDFPEGSDLCLDEHEDDIEYATIYLYPQLTEKDIDDSEIYVE